MAKLFDINSIRQNISGSTPEPASVPTPAPAPPKLTIPKNTQEQTSAPTTPSAPKLTIPKNTGMSVDRSKVSITPEELTSRLKGANIQTPFKSPEQKAESAKPVNPFRPYVNPDTKRSERENPAFQRNTASWLNIDGTTGTSRNRSAGKLYDWIDYTDENGNQISGMWSWWDDNGKRFNAVSSFAQDGQWHDRSSMRGYMQEAANLYYDYDEMADYMTGIIRDMENTIKTTKYETEAAKKADEAYLASMRTNLEGAKALRDSSMKLYDYMSTQNEYMDAYDDYHVKDASDSKNYSETYNSAEYGEIPGGRTPEDWDIVIESLNDELDRMPEDSPNGVLTRAREEKKRQLVIAEYARGKAAEEKAQIEKDNLGLMLGREYYNVSDAKGWRNIETQLQTQLDAIPETETGERKSVQDRLDYVHDFVKAGEYKDFYDKWKDVSDDELIRRIMELGADPEKTEEVIKPVETNSGSVDAQIEELQSKLYKLDSTSQEYLDTAKQLKELRAASEAEKAKAEEEKAKAETPAEKTPAELRAEKEEAERKQLELDAISYIRDIRLMTGSSKAFEDYKKANPDATAADWVESVKANADEKEALLVKAEDAAADAEEDMHKLRSRLDEAIRVAMAEGREVTLDDIKTDDLNLHGVEIDITDLDKTEQELDALLNKDIEAARMALSYARQQKAWADAYSEFDMTQQPDYKDKVKEGWKIMGSAEDLKNLLQDVRDLVTTGGMDTYEVVYPNLWSLKDKNDQITDDDINEIIDTYEASEFSPQMAERAKDLIRTLDPTVTDEEIESMLDRDAATITNDDSAIELLTDYGFSREDAESMVRKLKVGGNDEKILDALTPFVVDDGKMSFSEMMESVWKPTASNGIEKGEFSPEQLSNYYYILATEGLSAATDYALKVNNQLTSGYRDEVRKKMALLNDYRADHSTGFEKGLQYVATPWVTGIMNLTGIADFFTARNQVKYLGNSILSEAPSISEAADWITQDTNRQLTRDGASQLVLFFNNAYGSAVQSYEAMALGGALAKFLGIGESTVLNLGLNKGRNVHEFITTVFTDAAFFGSAASSRYRELIDRGVDPEKAMDNAIITGICEAAFEHISIENLYHAKDVADFTGIGDAIMSTIIRSGIEGSEEMCTELANYVFDRFRLGMEGDFFQSVEAYKNQGMTEDEAFAKAKKDLALKIGEAGAAGFVSGFMSIGPRTGVSYAQERFSVKDYERARGKTFLDHQYADGKNGGQALGEFLLKYDFFHENQDENADPTALPGKGRGDYSDTQHDVFDTIKNLADKASRGIASAEDIGRLVSLADSLDPKIMDDFMLANKDYAWQSDPARAIRVAENDLVAFLGVDKANAYIEAVGKNPDAFVVDDFYKGMLDSGTTMTNDEIASTETFLQQVFTGNGQLSAEAIADEVKNYTDPKAQLYILEFLRANQKQGTAQAEAQTEDAGNTYGLVVDESVNLEADNTPERVTNALIKGLTATWERAARAASDFRIMNQSFAKLQEMAQETLKQDARTEGTAAFAESESDETTPALSDFRDDGDSVTFRGKKFNRKEYVASVMEGKDPFSGETVENTTEEWANKSFDALLERASDESFGKSDEMSAEMVNFDLAKHTPKEKATATTASATAETNADKAAGGETKKTTSKTKPKNIPAKKNTPKGKNKAESKADKAAGGESKKTTPKKNEPKNIPAKKNLPKGKNKAEAKADTATGSTEETTTPVDTAPKTDEATELTGVELALAQKEDLDRIEREFRDEMGETSEEVPTVEELRDQEIESETDDGETSFGTTEGSTTRTWDDTFQLDGESITRADFVHSYMSCTDPLTGEDTYPLTQAQANAAFDRTYAYAMQQGGSIESDGSYSTDANVKTGAVSDVRQLALENELNALESILKNKKEAGDTIGRGLLKKIDYARKRIQDALGRQITRLGSDVESRRKELNDQLKAIDSRMNQIRQYIKNKAVGSLIFNKELDGLKAKRRDVKAKLTSLNNAVAAYSTAVDKLEDWRNRMYATDYYTILGGLTYDGRSSTDRNTERTGDVGDAGSSRTDVNTSADRTGTTEGAGGQTQRRTARSVEQVLSEAGLKLKGTVALDTAMVTARDIYNDKSLPRSVKTAILHALRNGVSRVIITDGTLQNESGQNIGGYTHLTKENGIDRSIFILNKQSKIPMQQNILHEYVHHMLGRLAPQNRASFLRNAMNVLFRGRQDLFEAVYNTYLDDYVKAYNLTLDADGKLSPEQALDIYEEIVADMYGMIPRFTAAQDEKLNAAMNPFLFDMRGRLLRYMELSGLEDYSREKWIGEDHQGLTHYDVEDFVGTRSAMGGTVEGKAVSPEVAAETGMLVDELTIPDSADGQPEIMNVSGNKKLSGKASIAPEYKATPKQSTKVNNSSVTKKTLTDKKGNLVNRTVREVRDEAFRKNREFMTEQGEAGIRKFNSFLDKVADWLTNTAAQKFRYLNFEDINNATLKVDPVSNQLILTSMVKNGDYAVNIDFGTICERRQALQTIMNELLEGASYDENGIKTVQLNAKSIHKINEALRDAGINTQCLICFVETKRYNQTKQFAEFTELWNNEVKKYTDSNEFFKFRNGAKELTEEHIEARRKALDGYSGYGKGVNTEKAVADMVKRLAKYSPEDLKLLDINDIASSKGRTSISQFFPDLDGLIKKKGGSAAPKPVYGYIPYNGEIEGMYKQKRKGETDEQADQRLRDYIKSIAGVRSQSFSDFIITHVFDHLQKTGAMAAKGFVAHTYTKVLARAELFGLTGEKINMSLLFDINPNVNSWYAGLSEETQDIDFSENSGRLGVENARNRPYNFTDYQARMEGKTEWVQSFPYKDAVRIQNTPGFSKNTGTIGVSHSYWHTMWMLADPEIRQVIGYHSSSYPGEIKNITHLNLSTDYTDVQNNVKIVGIARPNYEIPDGTPSYATEPSNVKKLSGDAKRIALAEDEVQKIFGEYANGATVDISKMLKSALADKANNGKSKGQVASEVMQNFLTTLNENGLTLITTKAENGHGKFDLYGSVDKTQNPYDTIDDFIAYNLSKGNLPAFYEFSTDPNYYKLIFDFNMFDRLSYNPETGLYETYAPQETVRVLDENGELLFPNKGDIIDALGHYATQYDNEQHHVYDFINDESNMDYVRQVTGVKASVEADIDEVPVIKENTASAIAIPNEKQGAAANAAGQYGVSAKSISDTEQKVNTQNSAQGRASVDKVAVQAFTNIMESDNPWFENFFEQHPDMNFPKQYGLSFANGTKQNKVKRDFTKFAKALPTEVQSKLLDRNMMNKYTGAGATDLPWYVDKDWIQLYGGDAFIEILKNELNKETIKGLTDSEIDKFRPDLVSAISAINDRKNGKLDSDTLEESLNSLRWTYKNNPSLNYLTRLANASTAAEKTAIRKEFEKMLSGIDNGRALWYMRSYSKFATPAYVSDNDAQTKLEGSAQKLFGNIIDARRNELALASGQNSAVGMETREYDISEIRSMFNELNKDESVKALADKVFPVVEKLGLTIRGVPAKRTGSRVAGHAFGSIVEYNVPYFNNPQWTDQKKASTLLHELIHSATSYAINAYNYPAGNRKLTANMREAVQTINRVYYAIEGDSSFEGMYGVKSPSEMLAELSNPQFREKLEKKSLWTRLVDAIKQFFGIDTHNALDAASIGLDYLLDNFDYNAYLADVYIANDALHDFDYSTTAKATSAVNQMTNQMEIDDTPTEVDGLEIYQVDNGATETIETEDGSVTSGRFCLDPNGITTVTYFAGAGTLDYAIKDRIFNLYAVEWDPMIRDTFIKNNGNSVMITDSDVNAVEPGTVLAGHVDYFHASPVCKNFSRANNKAGEQEIDRDFARSIVKALKAWRPKVFTLENVRGYIGSDSLKMVTDALTEAGYKFDYDVYRASDYGASTIRDRLFVRAVLEGELPAKPEKTGSRTWWEAVEDIIPELDEGTITDAGRQRLEDMGIDIENLKQPLLILSGTKGREIQVAYADQPSPILMTKGDEARIILTDGAIKKVSPDVFARIQGIGDDWIHPKQIRDPNKVHQTNAFKVLGNGIPVELSRAVINPLLDIIEKNKGKASIEYSDVPEDVKVIDRKYSLAGPSATSADLGSLSTAIKMELDGAMADDIWEDTGWYRGIDNKWKFEIFDGDFNVNSTYLDERAKLMRADEKYEHDPKSLTDYEMALTMGEVLYPIDREVPLQKLLINATELFRNYPQLRDIPVAFKDFSGSYLGMYYPGEKRIELTYNFLRKESSKERDAELLNTLIHEIQHAIQDIEGFASGSNKEWWGYTRDINGNAVYYTPKDVAQQSILSYQKALGKEKIDEIYEVAELRDSLINYTAKNRFQTLLDYQTKLHPLVNELGAASVADLLNSIELYSDDFYVDRKKSSNWDLYWNTAGEIEARDVQNRMGWSEEKRKSMKPLAPRISTVFTGVDRSGNAKSEGSFSIDSPVDVFGDPVSLDTSVVTNATPSVLSDHVFYADGNAYVQTDDGQTVVINNVTGDSPEAKYINTLETINNADRTATKPYTIPAATRNADDGYNLREQNAGLRRGSEEVSEEYQEESSGRTGSISERNEQGEPQGTEQESVKASLDFSKIPNIEFFNEDGEVVTSSNLYPIGSFQREVLLDIASNNLAGLERTINALWGKNNPPSEEVVSSLRSQIQINNKLTDTEKRNLQNKLNELIPEYGVHPFAHKDPKRADKREDVHLPLQINDDTKTRKFVQTAARNADRKEFSDQALLAALREDISSYEPISDAKARSYAESMLNNQGYNRCMSVIKAKVESNEKLTKYDIALAEMLMKSAELEGNYTDALQLLADIAIIGTNAGQVVQAMSMIKKLTPRGQLYYMQTLVNRLNRTYEKAINDPKNKMNKIIIPDANAKAVLTAKTQEDFEKAVEDLKQAIADQIPATWVDKWNAWRYLAMLGNPRTHVRNLFGNGMFAPAVFVKDLIARELESHTNLVDPEKRSRMTGATFRKDSAYMRFAEENFKVMKDILSGEATDNKYTNLNEIMKLRKIWSDGPIGKFIKGASDLNSKGLETEDLIFLKLYYKRAFAEFLQARGVKEEDLDSTWGTTKETKKVMYEAQAWALREAQRNTYRDANAIATTLNQLKHKNAASYVLLEGLVPFTKTPLNILNRGIEYSPIGLIQSIVTLTRDLRSGQFTTSEAIDRLAAGLTGTFGLTLLGFILAQFGLLRGMGPDDDKEREFDTLQGHQNWSIEVGDVSYTIDWMAPAALPLFVGCSIHDMLQGDFNAFTVWDIGTALSRIAEPLTALSMLDGLNSTLSSIASAQENSSLSTLAGSILMSYVSQGMPTLAGQFARVFDEDRRATYVDKNSTVPAALQKFIQKSIQAKVPGWENQKMAYVDEWGRTDSSDTVGEIVWKIVENFLSPGYGNKIVSTSVDDELKRLYEATKDNSVLPNKGAKYLTNEGEKKDFTAKEYEEFSKVRGATAFDLLAEIFATSDYQELDDDNKKKIIESVYSYADSIAKQEIVPDMALRSKWMETAKAIGPADYILIKSDIDDSKTNEKLFAYLASNPRLNESQIATIIAQKYDAPDEVKSVSSNGYIYSLTEEDEEAMSNIFAEVVNERLAELRRDPAYLNADSKEQGRLINDLYAQAREDTKTLYGSMLDGSGRAVELGKASSVGREAFQMVLDVDGGTSEQAGWLSDMYSADKSIKNPLHSGFNLSLDNAQRRELKQEFANAWNTAYKDLVNSAEFKSAPSRAYKNNMIADRYNAVAQQVEEAYAASVYRSGKYTETFGTPSGYTWGEAYSIAKTNLKTPAEQAEWLAQKYSTGSKINNPDRSAFVISLTGAQQAEIKEDFVKEFVPRYTTLVSSSGWSSLSEEQRQARINDLQKKVASVVEDAYARKLVGRGYYSEELSTDSSYEKYYTMLSTEKLTDTQRKQLLKDKYVGGTISNPEAKEYRIQVYRKFIDDSYGKYVKNGTAAEFEKLHTEASNASGDAVKKKYGIKKLADVPDIEYPSSGAVSLTTGYTPTKPIIPIASTKPKTTTTQQSGLASKYGVIPRK